MKLKFLFKKITLAILVIHFYAAYVAASTAGCDLQWIPTQKIESVDDVASVLSHGGLLTEQNAELFDLYLKTNFGDANELVASNNFLALLRMLQKYPELAKKQFRDVAMEHLVNVYASTGELNALVKSKVSSAGQVKSSLYQIEANLGFWQKLVGYEFQVPQGVSKEVAKELKQKQKERMLRFLNALISKENREKLAAIDSGNYQENATTLFKVLEHYRNWARLRGRDTRVVSQAMVDTIATVGFFNAEVNQLLKSENAIDRIQALRYVFDEQEEFAKTIGFKDGFSQALRELGVDYATGSHKTEHLLGDIEKIEKEILATMPTQKSEGVVRIRSLSLQESPFRSLLGGDCATRTYFSKALDPNFIYFTMTKGNRSSGQITIVLGEAFDAEFVTENTGWKKIFKRQTKGAKVKVAFIDKIQNVPNEVLLEFLEGVRRSLALEGYELAISTDLGLHNGISNYSNTTEFLKHKLFDKNYKRLNRQLQKFEPHAHRYSYEFENEFSRAYSKHDVWVLEPYLSVRTQYRELPTLQSQPFEGVIDKESVLREIVSGRDSAKEQERLRYIAASAVLIELESRGVLPLGDTFKSLQQLKTCTNCSFTTRKSAYFKLLIYANANAFLEFAQTDSFSEAELKQIYSELRTWGASVDTDKVRVINHLKYVLKDSKTPQVIRNRINSLQLKADFTAH